MELQLDTYKAPLWRDVKSEICNRISSRYAPFKIVLKTKNETHFLRDWIEYHGKIVGLENLVIFDNMSDDRSILEIYREYHEQTLIVQYDGFHNYIHVFDMFRELYFALSKSCRYFAVLDTDEFLTFIDREGYVRPDSILDVLSSCHETDAFPACWLYNFPKSNLLFHCGSIGELEGGLRWGKPIIRSNANLSGLLLHNDQLPPPFFRDVTNVQFFLLHLTSLYPDQRISVNLRKLAARGVISSADDLHGALVADISNIADHNVGIWIGEIKRFLGFEGFASEQLRPGSIQIEAGCPVKAYSPYELEIFDQFRLDGTQGAVSRLFAPLK